jgi:hypothetical protein
MSTLPQATGNALINCIHVAQEKYESNAMDWQRVVEIGWRLLIRQDMESLSRCVRMGFWWGAIM